MKILKRLAAAVVALAVIAALAAPIGPLPGFFIGGTPTATPDQWPDTSGTDEILLKVPGVLPHVVTIWVIEHDGALHVVGAPDSGWVERIGASASVEMRLDDRTYELTARRLADGWQPVLEAYVAKYRDDYPDIVAGFPPLEEAEGQFALFRLERPAPVSS